MNETKQKKIESRYKWLMIFGLLGLINMIIKPYGIGVITYSLFILLSPFFSINSLSNFLGIFTTVFNIFAVLALLSALSLKKQVKENTKALKDKKTFDEMKIRFSKNK